MPDNGYKNIDEQDFLTCILLSSTKRPQEFSLKVDSLEIQSYTKEYACDVIFQKVEKLIPSKVIQADRFPIEPFRSNIDYLIQENDSLYFAVEKCVDGCHPRSFSLQLGVRSHCAKFMNWCVTIDSDDPQLYQAHLVHRYQFKRSCERIKIHKIDEGICLRTKTSTSSLSLIKRQT